MEKGESLSDWSSRSHPDLFQGITVLVHVATRLRDMHAAGYVHRDIKPGNIMLLPRKNSWTVIDFGCSAATGEDAPLFFTVQYSPPEVIEAWKAKKKTIVATEAIDAWALGVVAFELLTGGSAFSLYNNREEVRIFLASILYKQARFHHTSCVRWSVHSRTPPVKQFRICSRANSLTMHAHVQIMDQLQGSKELPWEGDKSADARKKLGMFRHPILSLLRRDPEERDTLARFCSSCTEVFTTTSTHMPSERTNSE